MDASGYDRAPFIPELYDYVTPYAARPDIGFYVEAARTHDGPVLELGCGTGRILIPTAQAGIDISGLDGDLTNLFLMDAGSTAIMKYSQAVEESVRPLAPFLIYFYQDDVEQAIRAIAAQRGQEWVEYQVNWKLHTAVALGCQGLKD